MATSARSATDSAASRNDPARAAARRILPRIAGEQLWESSRKVGRRGKKIPATGRAVADGFVVRDRPAADGQGPWGFLNRAGAAHSGQGWWSPRRWNWVRRISSMVPRVRAWAMSTASDSIASKSRSSPGPASPKARRVTIFPQPVGQVARIGPILGLALGERHRRFVLELGDAGGIRKVDLDKIPSPATLAKCALVRFETTLTIVVAPFNIKFFASKLRALVVIRRQLGIPLS